jgi:pimeloyl-ACP methyl ester carboxylesterase
MEGVVTKRLVVLIHGIRTKAEWQDKIKPVFETGTETVVKPLGYGYFDLFRFLCPFGPCRQGPILTLTGKLLNLLDQYQDHEVTVVAHSYGTYAISQILFDNSHIKIDHLILCGSIVPKLFDWSRVQGQIRQQVRGDKVINECGSRDCWPVLAGSVTWGYGSSGTDGFKAPYVRDRFHNFKHSDFLNAEFAKKCWLPIVNNEQNPEEPRQLNSPTWFKLFLLPLNWIALVLVVLIPAAIAKEYLNPRQCHIFDPLTAKMDDKSIVRPCFSGKLAYFKWYDSTDYASKASGGKQPSTSPTNIPNRVIQLVGEYSPGHRQYKEQNLISDNPQVWSPLSHLYISVSDYGGLENKFATVLRRIDDETIPVCKDSDGLYIHQCDQRVLQCIDSPRAKAMSVIDRKKYKKKLASYVNNKQVFEIKIQDQADKAIAKGEDVFVYLRSALVNCDTSVGVENLSSTEPFANTEMPIREASYD